MEKKSVKERLSNFELLRIIAMLMIVASHYSLHGVVQTLEPSAMVIWDSGSFYKKIIVELFTPGSEIGVAIFFLLAGYFGITRKKNGVLRVVLETVFYGSLTTVTFILLWIAGLAQIHTNNAMYALFESFFVPVSSGAYWFVTVYILISLVSPLLNHLVNQLNTKGQVFLTAFVFVFEYALSEFGGGMYFLIQRGLFFYIVGAVIRKNELKLKVYNKIHYLLPTLIICWGDSVANFIVRTFANMIDKTAKYKLLSRLCLSLSTDVFVPLAAIVLFMMASNLKIGCNKTINLVAKLTFGIYLIHDSVGLRMFIWDDLFKVAEVQYSSDAFLLYAILTIVTVFAICVLIDLIRIKFIEPIVLYKSEAVIDKMKDRYCVNNLDNKEKQG